MIFRIEECHKVRLDSGQLWHFNKFFDHRFFMCVCNLKKKKRKEKKKQPKQRVHEGESELFSFDSIPVHFG